MMTTLPSPHQIKITNQHSLRTDGQAGDEEEQEVKGGDTLPKLGVSVHILKCKGRWANHDKRCLGKRQVPDLNMNMMM